MINTWALILTKCFRLGVDSERGVKLVIYGILPYCVVGYINHIAFVSQWYLP